MRQYKIYALTCPTTNEIRYIGQTYKELRKRLVEHCNPSKLVKNTHKNNWIKSLLVKKLKPNIIELDITTSEEVNRKEIFYIKKFKEDGYKLTNGTNGGFGHLNHPCSPETITKILNTKRTNGTLKHSVETIEKIRIAQTGKKQSISHIKKITEKTRISILQCDMFGNIIKEWKGLRLTCRELNLNHSILIQKIKKNVPYGGFIWKYKV